MLVSVLRIETVYLDSVGATVVWSNLPLVKSNLLHPELEGLKPWQALADAYACRDFGSKQAGHKPESVEADGLFFLEPRLGCLHVRKFSGCR